MTNWCVSLALHTPYLNYYINRPLAAGCAFAQYRRLAPCRSQNLNSDRVRYNQPLRTVYPSSIGSNSPPGGTKVFCELKPRRCWICDSQLRMDPAFEVVPCLIAITAIATAQPYHANDQDLPGYFDCFDFVLFVVENVESVFLFHCHKLRASQPPRTHTDAELRCPQLQLENSVATEEIARRELAGKCASLDRSGESGYASFRPTGRDSPRMRLASSLSSEPPSVMRATRWLLAPTEDSRSATRLRRDSSISRKRS